MQAAKRGRDKGVRIWGFSIKGDLRYNFGRGRKHLENAGGGKMLRGKGGAKTREKDKYPCDNERPAKKGSQKTKDGKGGSIRQRRSEKTNVFMGEPL